MAVAPILSWEGLGLIQGSGWLFQDIDLHIAPRDRLALIGRNGAGKTTLLRLIADQFEADKGLRSVQPGTRIVLLEQDPFFTGYDTLMDFALAGDDAPPRHEVESVAGQLGIDLSREASSASGGERRRAALCRALASEPDLLLLDEPTNHLDAESVFWLERFLQDYAGTVVAITHDRYFLDNVAKWILELDRGRGIPFEGNYSSWLEQKQERLAREEKSNEARRRTLERELEWVRMAPKARQAKGKARLAAYEKLQAEAEAERDTSNRLEIAIPPGPRLGDTVIEVKNLRKGFGDRLLIEDLSFSLPPAGIVGIIGPNGAGKTTLFKMLTGIEQPDSGEITVGSTVQLSHVDQGRDDLDADKTVYEEITGGVDHMKIGNREIHGRAYVASFNFKGTDQQKLVGKLSGGERNRVHLAKLLKSGGNVLLLDEPTNDLDVDTLRALESGLESFPGCAVVISHDRWFLDRIATHVLAFEGDSQVRWFEGNFSEYEEFRRREFGASVDQPHRIKYKKLA